MITLGEIGHYLLVLLLPGCSAGLQELPAAGWG